MSKMNRRGLLGLFGLGIAAPAIAKALPPAAEPPPVARIGGKSASEILWQGHNEAGSFVVEANEFGFIKPSDPEVVYAIADKNGAITLRILSDGTVEAPTMKADRISTTHHLAVNPQGHITGWKSKS